MGVAEVMGGAKLLKHMNAGNGEFSYANSSTLQRKIIQQAKPVLEDAIKKMFNINGGFPKCFNMADLGCSSGPNTLFTVSNIIKIIKMLCHEKNCKMPEFQAYLNDLPDNDFNTIFKLIPSFYQNLKEADGGANCFVSGVPGSFYERLFPSKSLHLVHSSYSLHWLSQAPQKIENKNSIYITKTSPRQVFEAYRKQFEKDFSRFLQLRSKEIVTGGHLLLTFIGRSIPDPYGNHCAHLDLLSKSIIDLIHEGLIEQAELDSFNYPFYTPYKDEIENIVQTEGSFHLDTIKFFQVNWDERDNDEDVSFDAYSSGKHVSRTMRAVLEQMLVSHFQLKDSTVDYLFERYAYHLACHLLVQKEAKLLMHMNAGNGEFSYANSSALQRKIIQQAKLVLEDVIKKMFNNNDGFPKCFNMADLGCSSGPNTLFAVSNIIKNVKILCDEKSCKMPEFQAYLNDLPDNDFNTIFKSVPLFYQNLKEADDEANCFVSGVPGSFYERLFPSKSLHLVHSSSSLHFLSQAPEKIENNNSIYITCTSPPQVFEAYMKQFEKDFSRFLQLRSEEIVTGGHMLLTFIGRSIPDPYGNHCAFLDLLSKSLIDLVLEGLIEQVKLDSFNFPFYAPYKDEVEKIIQMEGSFDVDTLEFFQVNWDERDNDEDVCFDAYSSGKRVSRTIRASNEQKLVSHFQLGDSLVDYLFERYAYHVASHLLVQKGKFFNIVISLRKK